MSAASMETTRSDIGAACSSLSERGAYHLEWHLAGPRKSDATPEIARRFSFIRAPAAKHVAQCKSGCMRQIETAPARSDLGG